MKRYQPISSIGGSQDDGLMDLQRVWRATHIFVHVLGEPSGIGRQHCQVSSTTGHWFKGQNRHQRSAERPTSNFIKSTFITATLFVSVQPCLLMCWLTGVANGTWPSMSIVSMRATPNFYFCWSWCTCLRGGFDGRRHGHDSFHRRSPQVFDKRIPLHTGWAIRAVFEMATNECTRGSGPRRGFTTGNWEDGDKRVEESSRGCSSTSPTSTEVAKKIDWWGHQQVKWGPICSSKNQIFFSQIKSKCEFG